MAVSSVSPPSASPTEGDDLCETDVTNVAIHSVTLLISLCGLAGNGALFCLLRRKGHTDSIFLLFPLPSALLFLQEDVSCSPIMAQVYVRFLYLLSVASCYCVLFWLTAISTKKDMKKLCKLCCHCDLPIPMMWVVGGAQFWAFFTPITAIPTVTFLCPAHQQEHSQVALTSMFTITLLLFAAPVVISSTINFIKAKCGSQQQQPERFHIVIVLLVLFTLPLSVCNFLQQLNYTNVSSQVLSLFTCIHSTIKPIIYCLVGMHKRPCSVSSQRKALEGTSEGNTASSNDASRDMVTLLIPSHALLKDPGTVAEGFLEPTDQ